jgi:putative endonuclease
MLASKPDGVLYIGVTSAVFDRMMRHRLKLDGGFTARYDVSRLVYCEFHGSMDAAIARETRMKKWKRAWKVRLILETNPEWCDLFDPDVGVLPAPVDRENLL